MKSGFHPLIKSIRDVQTPSETFTQSKLTEKMRRMSTRRAQNEEIDPNVAHLFHTKDCIFALLARLTYTEYSIADSMDSFRIVLQVLHARLEDVGNVEIRLEEFPCTSL